jgi:hypothetical protein
VLLPATTGEVTGLVTRSWNPTWIAVLAAIVVVGVVLAVRAVGSSGARSRIRQKIGRNALIRHSPTKATKGAQVTDSATSGGRVVRSKITADGAAAVERKVSRKGESTDSPIDASS